MAGLQMDIDSMRRAAVSKENSLDELRGFILAQGPRQSANEHLVPEALFDDPNTPAKEAEGISAVKALKIAMQQGQKIYTITQSNQATVLPLLQHSAAVMQDIQNALAAGKVVTVSASKITYNGWTGSGYILLDQKTGAGAYLIGGGADGGEVNFFSKYSPQLTCFVSLLGLMLSFPALTGLSSIFMINFLIPFIIIALSALMIYATYQDTMNSECKASDSYGMIFEGFAFLSLGFAANVFTQLVANLLSTIASLIIIPNALEEQCK